MRAFNVLKPRNRTQSKRISRPNFRRQLVCEGLESRIALTAYIVNTLDDTNAADGLISLRETITAANTNLPFVDAPAGQSGPGQIDTIQFASSLNGQVITLGNLGTLQITDSLQIFDNNAQGVIISGNGQQILNIAPTANSVAISDVTLRNGVADRGGAIFVSAGTAVSLARVTLQNNRANDGGAVYNNGGAINILNSTLASNAANATSGSGGAIFSASGSVAIVNSQLSFNSATRAGGGIEIVNGTLSMLHTSMVRNDVNGTAGAPNPGNGGGLHVSGSATITIANGIITGNSAASEGGGLWNQAGSTLTVVDSLIFRNEARGNDATNGGGGIFNNGGIVIVTGSSTTISNNFASGTAGSGGGIFNDVGGTVTVTDAKILSNVANRAGGGIEAVAGTTTNLTNVLLSMNNTGVAPDSVAAPGNGGGFHITGAGNATITGGEVSDNVAAREGGGLWNGSGIMTINGTLITRNRAQGPAADDGGGGVFNNGGTVNVTGATISNNLASGAAGSGGGVLSLAGPVTLTGTTVSFNSANRAGGAIEVVDGNLNIGFSTFSSNNVNGAAGTANPGNGGAIHTSGNAAVAIQSGSFTGNEAAREGGAIWIQGSSSLNTSSNVFFVNNAAHGPTADDGGGALFNNGGSIVLTDTLMFANRADGANGSGGAIFNLGGSILATNLFVGTNTASRAGGGIEDSGGTLQLNNSTLANNSALSSPGNGGGLHITGASVVGLDRTLVSQNFAQAEGGGLWNSSSGSLTIVRSTVDRNSSPMGGGVFNDGAGGTIRFRSSTVSRNRATANGGGILSEGGRVEALNSTISSNSAVNGAGIQQLGGTVDLTSVSIASNTASSSGGGANVSAGTLTALNSLIASNSAVTGPDFSGTLNSGGRNLIGDVGGAVIVGSSAGNQTNVNPLLGPLQNIGGPTETHPLLTGSPARDAGSNAVLGLDQRGIVRPQGTAFDIGAFEAVVTSTPSSLRADVSGDSFVSAIDVLLIINRINDQSAQAEGETVEHDRRELEDVNGDGYVSPLDALLVINLLNDSHNEGQSNQIVVDRLVPADEKENVLDLLLAGADTQTWFDQLRRREFDLGLTSAEEETLLDALAMDQEALT